MDTRGRLIAGSHIRNEFILINVDDIERIHEPKDLNGHICQICSDLIEISGDMELFVACNECAFPVCRPCYEYERQEGNKVCPHCKTRYKRIKGSSRVVGDDEEDDGIDDLEHQLDLHKNDALYPQKLAAAMHFARHNSNGYGCQARPSGLSVCSEHNYSQLHGIPLLTYKEADVELMSTHHELIEFMGHGEKVHSLALQPRPMVPKKDPTLYGYGSVAWKTRLEDWKKKQSDRLQLQQGDIIETDDNNPDAPLMDESRQPLSRKIPIASSKINPYRLIILLRIIILSKSCT